MTETVYAYFRKIISAINYSLHTLVFKIKPTDFSQKVVKNITFVSLSTGVAGVVLLIYRVILVRVLGAAEFGQYSLVLSVSQFFIVPMLFGLNNAASRYVAGEEPVQRVYVIGTVIRLVAIFTPCAALLLVILSKPLSTLLHISSSIYFLSLVFAIFTVMGLLVKSIAFALHEFKRFSVIEAASAAVTLAVGIVCMYILNNKTVSTPIYSFVVATLVVAITTFIFIHPTLGIFDRKWIGRIFEYSFYSTLGVLSGFLLTSDRLVINHYFSSTTLGIYAAYISASSSIVINRILIIFVSVLFPTIAALKERAQACRLLHRIVPLLLVSIFAVTMVLIFILFKLFGHQYPYDFTLATLFSLSTGFYFVYQLYGMLLSAGELKEFRIMTYGVFILTILNLGANILLIPRYGIYMAAAISLVINILLLLFMRTYSTRVYLKSYI